VNTSLSMVNVNGAYNAGWFANEKKSLNSDVYGK
jgi:hypothetical protein